MKVLFNKIIVNSPQTEEKTESGLIRRVESTYSSIATSEVAFVGEHLETSVKVGDIVVFPSRAGIAYKRDGKDYLILEEKDLIAIE